MKSYKIKMLPLAETDLLEIIDYLSEFSDTVALNQYDRIIEKINGLKEFPLKYEEYRTKTTKLIYRKMVVDNYFVFYVVFTDNVVIHRIIHTKMNLDKMF